MARVHYQWSPAISSVLLTTNDRTWWNMLDRENWLTVLATIRICLKHSSSIIKLMRVQCNMLDRALAGCLWWQSIFHTLPLPLSYSRQQWQWAQVQNILNCVPLYYCHPLSYSRQQWQWAHVQNIFHWIIPLCVFLYINVYRRPFLATTSTMSTCPKYFDWQSVSPLCISSNMPPLQLVAVL